MTEEPTTAAPVQTSDPALVASAARLVDECIEVELEVPDLPGSMAIDKDNLERMADVVESTSEGVSASKRLLGGRGKNAHPAVLAFREAKRAILAHRDSLTIPKAALRGQDEADGKRPLSKKDAGKRLLRKQDVEEFDARLQYLADIYRTARNKILEELPGIKQHERERLGPLLYKDGDYDVRKIRDMEVTPKYKPTGLPLDMQQFAPEVYRRVRIQAEMEMTLTVELAAQSFLDGLFQVTQQAMRQLGNKVRLSPPRNHALAHLRDGELRDKIGHAEDPEIPAGQVMINVSYTKRGQRKACTEWFGPMTEDAFRVLGPYETQDRKRINDSVVNHLRELLVQFRTLGELFGPAAQQQIATATQSLQNLLLEGGKDSGSLAEELRNSDYFRRQVRNELRVVNEMIEQASTTVRAPRRVVRRPEGS